MSIPKFSYYWSKRPVIRKSWITDLLETTTRKCLMVAESVFADSELEEDSVIRSFQITAADGKKCDTKHF